MNGSAYTPCNGRVFVFRCLDIAAYADMLDVAIYVYHAKDARNGTHRVTYWNHEDVPAQKLKEMHIAVSYHGRHFEAMIPPFKGDWDFCDLDITLLNDLLEKGSPGIEGTDSLSFFWYFRLCVVAALLSVYHTYFKVLHNRASCSAAFKLYIYSSMLVLSFQF